MRHRAWGLVAAGALIAALGLAPATAAPRAKPQPQAKAATTEVSSQQRVRRAPSRITVYPRNYQPRPLYRQCVDGYVVEARATGPTVVPRERCWWVRG